MSSEDEDDEDGRPGRSTSPSVSVAELRPYLAPMRARSRLFGAACTEECTLTCERELISEGAEVMELLEDRIPECISSSSGGTGR